MSSFLKSAANLSQCLRCALDAGSIDVPGDAAQDFLIDFSDLLPQRLPFPAKAQRNGSGIVRIRQTLDPIRFAEAVQGLMDVLTADGALSCELRQADR